MILDFEGVSNAASSFLDELLGRLAFSLGEEKFRSMIKVKSISKDLLAMAEVVIHQRCNEDKN